MYDAICHFNVTVPLVLLAASNNSEKRPFSNFVKINRTLKMLTYTISNMYYVLGLFRRALMRICVKQQLEKKEKNKKKTTTKKNIMQDVGIVGLPERIMRICRRKITMSNLTYIFIV